MESGGENGNGARSESESGSKRASRSGSGEGEVQEEAEGIKEARRQVEVKAEEDGQATPIESIETRTASPKSDEKEKVAESSGPYSYFQSLFSSFSFIYLSFVMVISLPHINKLMTLRISNEYFSCRIEVKIHGNYYHF